MSNSRITPGNILRATAKSMASDINPFGLSRDPAKDTIRHPQNTYVESYKTVLSPIDSITMDECVKYPYPRDKDAIKYKPSQCIKIINHINKNKKTGICPGHLSKEKCIMDAANKLHIENPNEYGDPNDLLVQIEGYEREKMKKTKPESTRSKSPKNKSRMKTFKKMFKKISAISEKKTKAGRRTRKLGCKNSK